MPLTHSQVILAQHHHKRRTEKQNRNGHSGRNNTNMAVAGTCLLHAFQLHHQNSPQMDTSGQEEEGTTKRDMVAHCGERPQYQGTESRQGPQSSNRPSLIENPCCRLTCQIENPCCLLKCQTEQIGRVSNHMLTFCSRKTKSLISFHKKKKSIFFSKRNSFHVMATKYQTQSLCSIAYMVIV